MHLLLYLINYSNKDFFWIFEKFWTIFFFLKRILKSRLFPFNINPFLNKYSAHSNEILRIIIIPKMTHPQKDASIYVEDMMIHIISLLYTNFICFSIASWLTFSCLSFHSFSNITAILSFHFFRTFVIFFFRTSNIRIKIFESYSGKYICRFEPE